MKRIKRRQLKEDELVTTVGKVLNFVKRRTKEFMAAVTVVLAIILVFVVVGMIKTHNLKNESRLLGRIFQISSELKDNPSKLEELEKLAGNGKFSRLAYLQLASYWMEREEFDKALNFLGRISESKKDLLYYQSQDLLAQVHIKQKNYDKAIEIYKKIEEENPKGYVQDVVLFHKAQAHEEKGETEEALALYKKLQEEFPQTYFGFDATQKVRKLEEKK